MGYFENWMNPRQNATEIQAQARAQLDARKASVSRAARHRFPNSGSPFRPRLNYVALNSFLTVLFFAGSDASKAATINAASPSLTDVAKAVASARDGDTVIIPAGTASWTLGITVTKSITIQGQTTVNSDNGTANDQTIILDDMLSNNIPAIAMSPVKRKTVRVTGITFKPGTRNTSVNGGIVSLGGTTQATAVRLHHCHFVAMHRNQSVFVAAAVYGVIDHNVFDTPVLYSQSILVRMPNWNGDLNGAGDGSYADYPWFGTEKFIFIEDNYFNNTSSKPLGGNLDADYGARMVIRHNQFYDVQVQNHGTEHRYRGTRAAEVYNNDFHFTTSTALGGVRTGVYLYHDNTFSGVLGKGLGFSYLRYGFNFNPTDPKTFHGATGDEPWDVNATESDGTHVDGHSPYLFASGTCASGSNSTTIVDSESPGWTTNQWAGYTAKRVSDNQMSLIASNTSNTLTVLCVSGGYGSTPTWTAGDSYEIHKVLIAIDQPGRGKGDLLVGGYSQPPPTLNSVTGTAAWPHQALEPCYAWNNKYNGTTEMDFYLPTSLLPAAQTFLQEGRDFYNNSSSEAVVAKYTASLNGADYVGTYTYPHPLLSGHPRVAAASARDAVRRQGD
jgi:hypothetical protein